MLVRRSNPGALCAAAFAGALAVMAAAPLESAAAPVSIPSSVAPVFQGSGTGLCIAQAISDNVVADFGNLNASNFNANMNTFIEAHKADRVESVVRTLLDLSNNNDSGLQSSYGDFTNAMMPLCKIGGCDFLVNDTTTAFGARLRGYLKVTDEMVNQPIHFGLYGDDAVSLTFYGKGGAIFPVMTRPPQLGLPTWRLTETVTFEETGLYPLEILYAEIAEHAALEMSFFIGDFTDFERPANQDPVVKLNAAGFLLFAPEAFSQTLSGQPSYPDINQCKQCERQFVNLPGNNGCDEGYYCNDAALCAPCDSALLCGPSCSPCGGDTPFCTNVNGTLECVQCTKDEDCKDGYTCDLEKHICNECNVDPDCPRAHICVDHDCVLCDTADRCAGNSCNCCPKGVNGEQMDCGAIVGSDFPACIECTKNEDCDGKNCDLRIGRCVDKLPEHEEPECCGKDCDVCPEDAPFCLPTHIDAQCSTCRNDMDCPDAEWCKSGVCEPCLDDRRCGPRCDSCGGDEPFCDGAFTGESGVCVRCTENSQCGQDGLCNTDTHVCTPGCSVSCGGDAPYCLGDICVVCYADTQCPCGGTCDLLSHTCSTACTDNSDCQATDHCKWNDEGTSKECGTGQMPDDSTCGGTLATICQGNQIGRKDVNPIPIGGTALAALALLWQRRRNKASSNKRVGGGQ